MRIGLGISLLLHFLVAAMVFWLAMTDAHGPAITSVEMVSLLNSQKSQRQRVRGVKNPQPQKQLTNDKTQPESPASRDQKIGNDKEDAPEIQGGTNNPQLLAVARYAQELQNYLERNRYYPRRALVMEQTGTVKVRLRINKKGEFLSVEVIEPSPHPVLNRAAVDLVNSLGKFKPLPSSYRGNGEFDFPIRYQIGDDI